MSEENSSLVLSPKPEDQGKRLDSFLAEKIAGWSRSRLQKLIDDGDVLVNDKTAKSSYKISPSDVIEVELVVPPADSFTPENIPLDIIYEDDHIAVIKKAAGMVVHPGAGISGGTLANAIAWHFKFEVSNSKFQNRVGIVHRLDKETSGLIVAAKNEAAHENLGAQFQDRKVFKSYLALVHGQVEDEKGQIDLALARDRSNRMRMAVVRSGRSALSLWRVRERFEKFTLLEVEIKTGRTHQIRVHLAHIKHPVVGDELYNGGRDNQIADPQLRKAVTKLGRFFLHAGRLEFDHPVTDERMKFSAPLPAELEGLLGLLR